MEIIIILILSGLGILAFITWQDLHVRHEAARAACAVVRSAIQNQETSYRELNRASHDLARHEHGVHRGINRDWSNASRSQKGRHASSLNISHLNQSFPHLNASELFKELGRQTGTQRDYVKNQIVEANKKIEEFNSTLRTFPGVLLSGLFQSLPYVNFDQLSSAKRKTSHGKRNHRVGRGSAQRKI